MSNETPAAAVTAADEVNAVASSVAAVAGGNKIVTEVASDVASASSDVAAGKGISDFSASLIRTLVPGAVGGALTLLGAAAGIHIPAAYEPVIEAAAIFGLGGAYYAIVRAIEVKFPKAGWFLGVPKKPVYAA
jgi:hypothetical protein